MIRALFVFVFVFLFASCEPSLTSEQAVASTNAAVRVDVVTRVDGCTIYRVDEPRESAYHFVVCESAPPATLTENIRCGKHCVEEKNTQTMPKQKKKGQNETKPNDCMDSHQDQE